MNNYDFCTQWVISKKSGETFRILDYGCGAGQIVVQLMQNNVDAYGCDVFYEGADYLKSVDPKLIGIKIKPMKESESFKIPFDDNFFDCIINNQVMEHVEDIDFTLGEMNRVLRPNGVILSLFPSMGTWRETHCGVFFLHWFPKHSRFRVYYGAMCGLFGFGYHKEDRGIIEWSEHKCKWLDQYTHYRTNDQIKTAYSKYFKDIEHLEDFWVQQRLKSKKILVSWLPAFIQKTLVNKMCGIMFSVRSAK
ncbi:class I SAM-dependent methyltransferase [Nitrosomonas sp.]|uniref:class I SAM-dependent methyltransferase n=1 Tax=Nitrosomonas sp. TaxID=42353 RepID=UPI00271C2284|nr:class I SAM-dependent methyltransferase [Nitrosomonas sp.]MDO8894687.1 class I SAM-dependent methyltransferase [Nitrosomonas sp.]